MKERSDNQRLADISYQISLLVIELRRTREVLIANGEYIVSADEFNNIMAKRNESKTN